MSQWQQWFRGFVKGWFTGVAKGLSKLEERTRTKILENASNIQPPSNALSEFSKAWIEFHGESEVDSQVQTSLDAIPKLDDKTKEYLNQWMETFLASLKEAGGITVHDVLSFSGRMCAESHAQNLFINLWKEHGDLELFLEALNEKMGEGHDLYKLIDSNTIEVTYPKCFCPLVNFGLIKVPILCNCSSSWLKSNFEVALSRDVTVKKKATVLAEADQCNFIVQL